MKKTVTALALGAILIPAAVLASNYHGDRGEHRAERMAEMLQLTDQQRTEVQQIFAEQRDKRRAMREEMRSETRDKLASVLTPEQQAKWKQLRAERKDRYCGKHERDDDHGPRHEREDD